VFQQQSIDGDSYRRRENSYTPTLHGPGFDFGSDWGPPARAWARRVRELVGGSKRGFHQASDAFSPIRDDVLRLISITLGCATNHRVSLLVGVA
jgi:hypothetical protein